jgi:hypothetical protein
MGLRGPGAKPIRKRGSNASKSLAHAAPAPGASLYEHLVAFMEALPVTSGTLAGTRFKFARLGG